MSNWSLKYEYTEDKVNKVVPKQAGVYMLMYDSTKYYVFYVGQANNLERRLLEHLYDSEPDLCIKRHLREHTCYCMWLEVSSQSERDKLEQALISKYKPSCNS